MEYDLLYQLIEPYFPLLTSESARKRSLSAKESLDSNEPVKVETVKFEKETSEVNQQRYFPPTSSYSKKKRQRVEQRQPRTTFSKTQLFVMEKMFEVKPYPTACEQIVLGKELDLTEYQVKVWFKNRRVKWKREMKKEVYERAPPQQSQNYSFFLRMSN